MIAESIEWGNSNISFSEVLTDTPGRKTSDKVRIAIMGGGSWATALAKIALTNVKYINWYMRRQEQIDEFIRLGKNPSYLTGVKFDTDRITFTNDINKVVKMSDILIFATPSPFLKQHLKKLKRKIDNKIVVSAIKGIVPDENMLISDYFIETYKVPPENMLIIGGPCHAEEVALERLSYLTIACKSREKARYVADKLVNPYIHTRISDDVYGLEYTSVMKNIYAIAAGIAHGLGYGDNFHWVIMSNAIREMKKFIRKVHKMKRNINNSAYLGDLLVTGYSVFSRNRMFGNMIGKGYTVKSAQMEMSMVAEGYYAVKSAYKLNKEYKADTPIIDAVYEILYENKDAKAVFKELTEKLN